MEPLYELGRLVQLKEVIGKALLRSSNPRDHLDGECLLEQAKVLRKALEREDIK